MANRGTKGSNGGKRNRRTNLHLVLTFRWYDDIESGKKTLEYREVKKHYTKHLYHPDGGKRHFDTLTLQRGYTTIDGAVPTMKMRWKGFTKTTITHEHWDNIPKDVYAIDVTGERIEVPKSEQIDRTG